MAFHAIARLGIILGILLATVAFALWRRRRRSAAARTYAPHIPVFDPKDVEGGLSTAPLTALYFKSRFCLACQETPDIIREAAPEIPIRAVDLSKRPDLARKYDLVETPTLFLLDGRGRIRYARVGNPEPEELWTYAREAWDSLEAEGETGRAVA